MKISTILATALLAVSPIVNALPTANHAEEDHISEAATYMPINERDIHNGPVLRGAGHLQEQHLRRRDERLRKRNTDNQRITGVRVGYTGAYRVYRQEIRKFRNDRSGRVHDLFLLALNRMMARPASDVNSYWQLAGIHGRPFQGWAGDSASSWNQNGYCTHGSTLFPTWHRPYLAYFEEVVWANAEYIVNNVVRWQDREDWRAALMVLRLPYYDFTISGDVSDCFRAPQWTLRKAPNGQSSPYVIDNPLYSGKFLGGTYNAAFPGNPWNLWSYTRRSPPASGPSRNSPNAPSDYTAFNEALKAAAPNLRERVYQLLMDNNRWNTFSNRVGSSGGDSLESIHDAVHGFIGRSGHMSYVEYSSHDPIFFLLHCNVDRLFAIWQAINPTTYVTSQVNQGGTYGVPPGSTESRTSILRPFRGLSGGYWTSDGVRDTSLFGYGYFETPKWKYNKQSENEYARTVRATVEQLYGSRALSSAAARKRDIANATEAGIDASVTNNQYFEWRVDVIADKSEGNGTYFVHFFLGKPSKNAEEWLTQPELVGTYVCFTHTHQAAPGIDPDTVDNTVTGSVPLTRSMINAFGDTELNSLDPQEAATFLIKNLRWRATTDGGVPIRVRKLKGLKVSVSINRVTLPTSENPFRVFGDWTHLTDITRRIGRDGGPDKVNVIPNLSSSAAPVSSTDAPTTTSAPAADEATTTALEVPTSTIESTSSEEPTPTETST